MLHQRKLIIYGERFWKTQNILTGNGIWMLPGRRDSPKFVHGMRVFFCLSVEKSYVLVATANQPGESSVVSSSYSSKPCLFSSNITLSSLLIELDRLQTEFSGRSGTTNVTVKWSEKCVKYKYGCTWVVFCFIFVCFCFSLSLLTLDLNSRDSSTHGISSKFVEINLGRESYVDRWERSEH